jgi:hypothetical protein
VPALLASKAAAGTARDVVERDEWERICEECKRQAAWTEWSVVVPMTTPPTETRRGRCPCGKGFVQVRPLQMAELKREPT